MCSINFDTGPEENRPDRVSRAMIRLRSRALHSRASAFSDAGFDHDSAREWASVLEDAAEAWVSAAMKGVRLPDSDEELDEKLLTLHAEHGRRFLVEWFDKNTLEAIVEVNAKTQSLLNKAARIWNMIQKRNPNLVSPQGSAVEQHLDMIDRDSGKDKRHEKLTSLVLTYPQYFEFDELPTSAISDLIHFAKTIETQYNWDDTVADRRAVVQPLMKQWEGVFTALNEGLRALHRRYNRP